MPEMKGGVFFEHGHRMIASTVGFMTVILAVWIWKVEKRSWMKKLAGVALFAVILQGVLGGLTVLFLLPKAVSIAHACLAQLFFSTTVAIALFTSKSWREGGDIIEDTGWPSLRSLSVLVPIITLGQLALGASYRHQALGIMPHIIGAMLVMAFVALTGIAVLTQVGKHKILHRAASALLGVTALQIVLGIMAYMARVSVTGAAHPSNEVVAYTVAHVAVGALTMAAGVALAIEVFRYVRPKQAEVTSQVSPA